MAQLAATALCTSSFATTIAGCAELLSWVRTHGDPAVAGVEGTGSWGAGLTRLLSSEGITVIEVNRPDRSIRRHRGKTRLRADPRTCDYVQRRATRGRTKREILRWIKPYIARETFKIISGVIKPVINAFAITVGTRWPHAKTY